MSKMPPEIHIGNELSAWRRNAKFLVRQAIRRPSAPDRPHLDPETLAELTSAMRSCTAYLEYGAGGSTILAAKEVKGPVTSIESDVKFAQAVRRSISSADSERIQIIHADIGPTGPWGVPIGNLFASRWPNYPEAPWGKMPAIPDTVFVDGRFRAACVLQTFLSTPDGWSGVVILDDYEKRQQAYSALDPFIVDFRRVGRAAIFGKRADIDIQACRTAYDQFKFDPR